MVKMVRNIVQNQAADWIHEVDCVVHAPLIIAGRTQSIIPPPQEPVEGGGPVTVFPLIIAHNPVRHPEQLVNGALVVSKAGS